VIVLEILLVIVAAIAIALFIDERERKEHAVSPLTFYDQERDQ
jgi:hypothetical protein